MGQNYNIYEKKIAIVLSSFPRLKIVLKKLYQFLNYIVYRKSYTYKCINEVHTIEYKKLETFFGYYDKSPENNTGNFVLFHASSYSTRLKPNPNIPIIIAVYDLKSQRIISEFESYAYNWQQGARTQWLDDNRFIYNDFDKKDGLFISRIVNTEKSLPEKVLAFPVYDVKNKIALSLNFHRLAILRPDYGYKNKMNDSTFDIDDLANDGIFKIDLESGVIKLLISFNDILQKTQFQPERSAKHKVNHIMINPSGDRFIFLHRFFISGRRFDRLIVCGMNGDQMNLLADDEMASHYYWYDDANLVCFMRDFEKGDHYYLINVLTKKKQLIDNEQMYSFGDGHPNIHQEKMLFDSYPDKSRMKRLYVYDFISESVKLMGEFYESLRYSGETRCDLHPRWAPDGQKIYFDSVHTGRRCLYLMKSR